MRGELGDKIKRKKRQKSNMDRRKRDKGMNVSIDKNYVSNFRMGIFWELKWRH